MLLDVIIISFVIAFLRGGRLREVPKFHKLLFLGISLLLQVCSAILPHWGGSFVSVAYIFTLLFFYFNREHEDIRILMFGWSLNALAIWTNNGRMPIDMEQAKKLPYSLDGIINGTDFKHSVLTEASHLPFLTDIMYMPFPIARVFSIGDLFLMLGIFLLVQRIMNKPLSLIQLREGKYNEAKN